MKKLGLLKIFVVIGLSLLLIANLSSVVFADDFDEFGDWGNDVSSTNQTGNEVGNNTSDGEIPSADETSNTTNELNELNETNETLSTGNATTSLNTASNDLEEDDDDDNDVNSLAYTGASDNSVLTVVIVLGAIVAGYSLKKVRDYNGL